MDQGRAILESSSTIRGSQPVIIEGAAAIAAQILYQASLAFATLQHLLSGIMVHAGKAEEQKHSLSKNLNDY